MTQTLDQMLGIGDLDELLREIDRRCDIRDWDGVDEVRRRSRAAIERGHQLWPAASYAEYRLALDAPEPAAAAVITESSGWMAPGPLTEVVAQHHDWVGIGPELDQGAHRSVVAQERVLRGEVVPDTDAGELPGRLAGWEPDYQLAEYRPQGGRCPAPKLEVPHDELDLGGGGAGRGGTDDEDTRPGTQALADAVRHWASRSNGSVRAAGVTGDHATALAALGLSRVRTRTASLQEFGALLGWAASDGGAHGRRRGAAAGRLELWWCLAALTGLDDDWPDDPGGPASELRFGLWLPADAVIGWSCRLWVEDPVDGLAWALDASDHPDISTGVDQVPTGPSTRSV